MSDTRNRSFTDRYPTQGELLKDGGFPGVEYLLASPTRLQYWQAKGWSLTSGATDLVFVNEKPCMLLSKGTPIAALGKGQAACPYWVDVDYQKECGCDEGVEMGEKDGPSPDRTLGSVAVPPKAGAKAATA